MPLNRRTPKRGFWHGKRHPFAIVNVDDLEDVFDAGAEVSAETVASIGLARPAAGGLKVLARGEITKAFKVKAQAISVAARTKIEAAGGTVEILGAVVAQGGEE